MNTELNYKNIKTYPEMNERIKGMLSLSELPIVLYALKRIEELEAEVEKMKSIEQIKERLKFVLEPRLEHEIEKVKELDLSEHATSDLRKRWFQMRELRR